MVQVDGLGPTSRGLVLAAQGQGLHWYVDGQPLTTDAAAGRTIWRPSAPGFFRIQVVDAQGRKVEAQVRVRAP